MNSTEITQVGEYRGREHAVSCYRCGLTHRGRPLTMTWRLSGLCEGHELQRDAEDALARSGYGTQIARQIAARTLPAQRDRRS